MSRITIKDVAKEANVSVGTVSRVINGEKNVSKENVQKVLKAIETLGYVPNTYARGLVSGKTNSISIVVPMIRTDFYDRLINSVDCVLIENNYESSIFPLLSEYRLKKFMEKSSILYHSDGILMSSLPVKKLFKDGIVPTEKPVVLIDMESNNYDCVYIDNNQIGRIAANILLEKTDNLYVMTFIEPDTVFTSDVFKKRFKGFEEVLIKNNISISSKRIFHSELNLHYALNEAMSILKKVQKFPVGFFATTDLFGYGLILAANNLNLEVGKDIFIVGVDGQPWTENIGLTTIKQPIEEMSQLATNILLDKINEKYSLTSRKSIKFDPLVIRRTSA
ncbi:MAG: LacI family DNA-binding transcriptional regulator [Defluviitoga tunisiensis]|jgi:LacI family transcriptional regulator|uniref:DNA-binding transcriptional repressor n=1 Tax=Defluviitoga tunisiensis TaxID=1006576 RepID=A0A0C7P001_DEFTU|nr:LacI family DNA-binding transcriptional regulator [Defluviitoga tunisiensis]MDD3600747.1 LacI family DNA-binding transcriptional regulator [Defluviitoga tunisiensis]MDY0379010.1 LacI family DNA-binding transcriptional regulator [Defluviitoga tunisiensis]CEP78868.1 DNA-binding transcriptional repressor [Defluviitoga tunisiensis]HHV01529.1 LacI family transcriptional regulator [Defluviitoga tunisiensis]HOB55421.1 LacI family DNA-binding transcriptional regulator [Defluviitoga tunisiensis]